MIGLHLLRHGHAGNPARWSGDDADRPLSEKGRRQAEQVAALMATMAERPDLFITSPKVRAAETAEIVAKAVDARVVVDPRLVGPLDLDVVSGILADAGHAERPCLVGHDPDLSELLGELVGLPAIPMRKGALARVDVEGRRLARGSGILRYLVPPEILPAR